MQLNKLCERNTVYIDTITGKAKGYCKARHFQSSQKFLRNNITTPLVTSRKLPIWEDILKEQGVDYVNGK